MNPDGTAVVRVRPDTPGFAPSWSSDGQHIAFVALDPDTDYGWGARSFVSTMNADGTDLRWLAWGYAPTWRPWTDVVNGRPAAAFTVVCSALICSVDGATSSDADGTVVAYGWQFGDGSTASGAASATRSRLATRTTCNSSSWTTEARWASGARTSI